jgi:hypothetical protein
VLVDVCVQHGVLELLRRIAIYKDTGAAVLDHDVAIEGLMHDGVIPRAVDGRVRAGGDSESRGHAGILTDDEFDDGADRLRREHEHARKYGGCDALTKYTQPVTGAYYFVPSNQSLARLGVDLV